MIPILIAKHRDMLLGAPTRSHGQKKLKPRSRKPQLARLPSESVSVGATSIGTSLLVEEPAWAPVDIPRSVLVVEDGIGGYGDVAGTLVFARR